MKPWAQPRSMGELCSYILPCKMQLHNPSSALGRNQDGQWRLFQKGLFPQSLAPSVPQEAHSLLG